MAVSGNKASFDDETLKGKNYLKHSILGSVLPRYPRQWHWSHWLSACMKIVPAEKPLFSIFLYKAGKNIFQTFLRAFFNACSLPPKVKAHLWRTRLTSSWRFLDHLTRLLKRKIIIKAILSLSFAKHLMILKAECCYRESTGNDYTRNVYILQLPKHIRD